MLGLLLKDFYNIKKLALWYIALIFIFGMLSALLRNITYCASVGIVSCMVPLATMAYEEKDKWDKFVAASGTEKEIIALEKYIIGLIFVALCSLSYLIVFLFFYENKGGFAEYVLPVCFQIIIIAIIMPIIFRFGVERGRVYTTVTLVVSMVLFVLIMMTVSDFLEKSGTIFSAILIAVSAIILCISYIISVKILNKKEY